MLVSYGDIIYGQPVLQKILDSNEDLSVVVDDRQDLREDVYDGSAAGDAR